MSDFKQTQNSGSEYAANNVIPLPVAAPERLVGVGFRCWLSGLTTGDISAWAEAWNTYEQALGRARAKEALVDLSHFVRAVSVSSEREIEVYPAGCRGFCRDECLAISIIAACQHDVRPALTSCAAALIGSNAIGDTLSGAQIFAASLTAAKQVLSPGSVCPATCALRAARPRLI